MHTYDIGKSHIILYIHNTCEKAVNMIKYKIFPSGYPLIWLLLGLFTAPMGPYGGVNT